MNIEKYQHSGILPKWHEKEFKDFVNDPVTLKKILRYIDKADTNLKKGVGLYLYGSNGRGKTLLMNLSFKAFLEKGYTVKIISLSSLITKFVAGWYSPEEKRDLQRTLCTVDFLGIEELGKEFRSKESDLGVMVFDNILRLRVQSNLPIWITSNTPPNEISEKYSIGISSMLLESCVEVPVNGEDFRKAIHELNVREFKA